MARTRRWTKARVLALPEAYGTRFEAVRGDLIVTPMPPPAHQLAIGAFLSALANYLEPLGLIDTILPGPADISWSDDDLVRPDLFVVAQEDFSHDWETFKHFRLVIEVLSWASARRGDCGPKRRLYQQHGVETYWIVDPESHTVEVWHPSDAEGATVTDLLSWRVTPEAPELRLELQEVLRALS